MNEPVRWPVALVLLLAVSLVACLLPARPLTTPDGKAIVRIVFVGDSLIHRSQEDHDFLTRIQRDLQLSLPQHAFEVIDAGVNGNRIADIRDRLQQDVLDLHPAAVVLYWDSDVSDVDEDGMNPAQVQATRSAYALALENVLGRLVASRAHVIVSGPVLLGERPHGKNPKDRQADAYRRINHQMAVRFSVTYINQRHTFQQNRPRTADPAVDRGFLTEDGEHLNEQGARLSADVFARALEGWLHAPRVTASVP